MVEVAVVGAGAWGTALANLAARGNRRTALWTRDPVHAQQMRDNGENTRRLPGIRLAPSVMPVSEMTSLAAARLVLLAVPTQTCREILLQLLGHIRAEAVIVLCAKGIERGTGLFPSQVLAEIMPHQAFAVLSGPSFARDVALGLPTAVTLASHGGAVHGLVQPFLAAPWFRLYHSGDVLGVELGGAAKNVIAIACGIAAGRQLGTSAVAALMTRGYAEIARLGQTLGMRVETLMGLSGLGDLVLTCTSAQSRNYGLGYALGSGQPLSASGVTEGAYTVNALAGLALEKAVDMPIVSAVDAILSNRIDISTAIDQLLNRAPKGEVG